MRSLLAGVYLTFHFSTALNFLPAPVNLSVVSVNFHHVLHWDPGPGTPLGTAFKVFCRVGQRTKNRLTNGTRLVLKLKSRVAYWLYVQATHPQFQASPESIHLPFNPMQQTVIGPPRVSLLGCGNCIHLNISLPEADAQSKITDIQKFYGSFFRIHYRKAGEHGSSSQDTVNGSFTLENLQPQVKYCLQVQTMIRLNTNAEPSGWVCVYTSHPEPNTVTAALGALVCFLVLFSFAMVTLAYTGFLCEPKSRQPMVLQPTLVYVYNLLTLERTIPDTVSLSSVEPGKTLHLPKDDDDDREDNDEEEEDGGLNTYMDRAGELSSGSASCTDSRDASGVSRGSSGERVERSPPTAVDRQEVKGQTGADSGDQAGIPGGGGCLGGPGRAGEGRGSEKVESPGNVNLLSVMLRVGEEEEEEQEEQDATESSSEVYNKTGTPLPASDRGCGGYESRDSKDMDTFSGFPQSGAGETALLFGTEEEEEEEEDEEEEEEEVSGYMGR